MIYASRFPTLDSDCRADAVETWNVEDLPKSVDMRTFTMFGGRIVDAAGRDMWERR